MGGPAHRPYVVSEDVRILLSRWAPLSGFALPCEEFFRSLREEMKKELETMFPEVHFVEERLLHEGLSRLARSRSVRLVSLDRTYLDGHPYAIETTRLMNRSLENSGQGSRTGQSLEEQIQVLALRLEGVREVQLADDVLYSGEGLLAIVEAFGRHGIRVSRVIGGVVMTEARRKLSDRGLEVSAVVEYDEVVDEICERDFYAGVPFSGRLLGERGKPYEPETSAPYFLPFGLPTEWASIPAARQVQWSVFCLSQSAKLWRRIGETTRRLVHCSDLPRLPRFVRPDHNCAAAKLEEMATALSSKFMEATEE